MAEKVCSFCGKKAGVGAGCTLFKKSGESKFYCSRKCERNDALKRKARKLKWTQEKKKKSN